jgi:hypothetical protein
MTACVNDQASLGLGAPSSQLHLVHDLMTRDDPTAAVARSVGPAPCECLATGDGREVSGAHTLTDQYSQFSFAHGTCPLAGQELDNGGSRSCCTIKQVKTATICASGGQEPAYFAFCAMTLQRASIAARRALVFRQIPPTCRTGAGRVKGRITTPRALP